MSRRAKWVVGVLAAIVAVNALLAGLDRLTREPSGPDSSSYATAPGGLAAYADLLARDGHRVRRVRDPLDRARLAAGDTVVLLDPRDVAPAEARALRRFLRGGGRLVAGGAEPGAWLEFLLGERAPRWSGTATALARPLAPAPETAGVGTVLTTGDGGWARPRALLPLLGARRAPLAVAGRVGRGRLVLLADASPLQNRLLGSADNAAFGLALAGARDRAVMFAEAAHGYGRGHGLAALPDRWKWALGGLVLAALVWMLAHARRLGPPEDAVRPLPPARGAYVDALAAALERTRAPDKASAPVAAAVRARLRLDADAPPEAWRTAGLTDEEVAALREPADGQDAVLARGRALARTHRGGG